MPDHLPPLPRPSLELPEGLPHPVGPRLMIEKGAFSSRTVVVVPDGTIAPDPIPAPSRHQLGGAARVELAIPGRSTCRNLPLVAAGPEGPAATSSGGRGRGRG
jgi:hypothetical protein